MTTTISNLNLKAQIKHLGAELVSLKNNQNKEFIWEGDPIFWGKHSPVLFPIVGTLKSNIFFYQKKEYHLSRHGFAREMEFKLITKSENSATFSLTSSMETRNVYPFNFELQICYSIEENKLIIEYKVINNTDSILPFSIGAHPAFALPNPFEQYALLFDSKEVLTSFELENDLLSDKTERIEMLDNEVPLTYSLFEKDALIFKKLQSKSITILENKNPMLRVRFDDFPNLGIWTKKNAPFLCIEPWVGYSDTIHSSGNIVEKEGIKIVEANQTVTYNFSIEIL